MAIIVFLKTNEESTRFNYWYKEVFVGISDLLRLDLSFSAQQIQDNVERVQREYSGKCHDLQIKATVLALESVLRNIIRQQLLSDCEN
ncbi:hypothetical protein ENUP19_0130G0036 [Entamoeba nuttalli]|uniref:Uncharacterized protein n=2 Tax=Entamoeba nuttalli TaxID=412467 RepID=K2H4M7_ENTNP|nr:hypothetical protein ENU1_061670 [Entamoeba nuttalli P19]EKE41277.1 hypothetical protein ENU1_061670 [Entamoeba nuttalli P19]|eukprot:XP_008856385.1 hypothetical protein ENU1_061670 [Entamoeba nuttalli P19]